MIEFSDKIEVNHTLFILEEMQSILKSPDNWTQGYMAKDAEGRQIHASSDNACKWCVSGAYNRAQYNLNLYTSNRSIGALTASLENLGDRADFAESIVEYNDHEETSYYDIIELIDYAILNVKIWVKDSVEMGFKFGH